MPIVKPAAKNIRPDALELFTDRVEEQQLLRKLLAPEPSATLGTTFLLTQFYGVGGVGKSTLCHRASEIAAAEFKDTVRVVATSFDDNRWKEGAAFTVVSAELCRCLVKERIMPRLTVALLLLHGQQTGDRHGQSVGNLDAGWSIVFGAIDKMSEFAPFPGVATVFKGLHKLREHDQSKTLRQRLAELGLWPEEQYGKLNILDLEKKLSSALYYDLLDWLKENPGQHVRLLLDGFERLQSSERREDSQRRLQEFIGYFAGPDERDACDRFRVVIFGRNQLRWDEIYEDPTWRNCWTLHLLGGLAEADARDFLKKTRTWLAAKGQTALAEALVKYEDKILDASDESKGGHRSFYPFYLNLAVELVERARQSGQELELGRAPAELQDRFFRYLDPRELRALMILALSEVCDESLFDWLAKERLIEFPQHSFHSQLRREHSYLQAVEGRKGDWRFHRLMEDALHARWQSTAELKREGVNLVKRLLNYYDAPLLAKPERDWADSEVEQWRRGMEIIVKQGPELGLLAQDEWITLLKVTPWCAEQFRCVTHRLAFTRRILREQECRLGPEHPNTLCYINKLGFMLFEQGDYESAEGLCRQAQEGREKVLGFGHPDTVNSVENLGKLLFRKGDYDRAEGLFRRALKANEISLGMEHKETLGNVNNLGILLDEKGDYRGAEELYRRALVGRERILGADHPETLKSVNNVGIILAKKGDYSGAETIFRRVLASYEKDLGIEHPITLTCVNNLGTLLSDKGDYTGAEILFRRAIISREKFIGSEHPDTLDSVNSLAGLVFRKTQRLSDAIILLRGQGAKSNKCLAAVRYHLACYECLIGNLEEAKRLIAEEIAAKPAAREQALKDDDLKAIYEFIRLQSQPQ
jgi:tetratricopeptide (TPR) repeat protein